MHSPALDIGGRGYGRCVGEEEGENVLEGIPGHLGKLGHHRGSEEQGKS